jgi:spermidine synthase
MAEVREKSRLFFSAGFFAFGFYSIIVQVIFLREFLAVLFGNELAIGLVLSSWLFGIFFGASVGARIADRKAPSISPFILSVSLLAILSPAAIFLIRSLRLILDVPAGELITFPWMFLSVLLIVVPISFFVGLAFPFACRFYARFFPEPSVGAGSVYLFEALGSLAGGALFTYFLVARLSPFSVLLFSILVLSFFLFLIRLRTRARVFLIPIFIFVIASLLFFTSLGKKIEERGINLRWQGLAPDYQFILSRDSRYQNIALGKREDQFSIFGNGGYISSFPDPYTNGVTAGLIISQHPDPERVLVIGGGVSGVLSELLRYPIGKLDYVQLDPALIDIVEAHMPSSEKGRLSDPRLNIFFRDGREFIKKKGESYDLILVNLPPPSTAMLNRYYTREFFREISVRLSPGGVIVSRLPSASTYLGGEVGDYARCLYQTLKEVFPFVLVTPGEENFFFASKEEGVATTDPIVLSDRYLAFGKPSPFFTSYHFQFLLPPERVRFVNEELSKSKLNLVNTDLKPLSYFYSLILWIEITGQVGQTKIRGAVERFLIFIRDVPFFYLLIPFIILFAFWFFFLFVRRGTRGRSFNILFAITTTGGSAMAIEIMLLFSFQSLFGYVYQQIGVLVALFMFGLALGAHLSNRFLLKERVGKRRWRLFFFLELLVFSLLITLPSMLRFISFITLLGFSGSQSLFMTVLFLAGILTGMEFPVATRLYLDRIDETMIGKAGGRIDAADHLGAAFGALITGVFLIPLFGLTKTTFLFCLVKGASASFIGIVDKR